jgi:hypothetical protein
MNFRVLTNRELYIKSIFLPENKSTKKDYLSEDKVDEIIESISNIGERYGFVGDKKSENSEKSSKRKHKYDVWIAKEIKKSLDLLNRFNDIRLIIDWAIETKADIFTLSFDESFLLQDDWHKEMFKKYDVEELKIKKIQNERVLFRCSNKKHFFYLLTADDLTEEGKKMGMCVGGENYKSNIRNGRSIIISLRDEENNPHVTTEINVNSGNIVQQYSKGNSIPPSIYRKMMIEFALFSTNYEKFEDIEIIKLLNLNQTF